MLVGVEMYVYICIKILSKFLLDFIWLSIGLTTVIAYEGQTAKTNRYSMAFNKSLNVPRVQRKYRALFSLLNSVECKIRGVNNIIHNDTLYTHITWERALVI